MGRRPLSQTVSDSPGGSEEWRPVLEALAEAGWEPVFFEPLAGDVSARRYGRLGLVSGERRVVCSYPDDMKDVAERFLGAGDLLAAVDVPTPRVDGYSLEYPVWILLEDLGPHTLFERWTAFGEGSYARVSRRLVEARELIRRIQLLPPEEVRALGSPPLDRALLMAELEQTWVRFLEPRGLVSDARLAEEVRAVCAALCERLDSATPVPCHRDFMARNLMLRAQATDSVGDSEELVLIDHQDLRLGPPCYDLASLLNDTLKLSVGERQEHLSAIREDAGLMGQYHAAAAQRTLKIAGTFAHFATVGSDRYLRLIPPALLRFLDALAALPEGRDLAPRLRRAWASVTGC